MVIPNNMKQEMLTKLHSTHLSERGMKELARGKLWWNGISKDIKNLYETCKENSISKMNKDSEVIPYDLQLLAPNEVIHIDFCQVGNKNVLVLKDKATGWLSAKITKDQTTESVEKVLIAHSNLFWRVHKEVTDDGPSFKIHLQNFSGDMMSSIGTQAPTDLPPTVW